MSAHHEPPAGRGGPGGPAGGGPGDTAGPDAAEHLDVAAYALGVLDPDDRDRFEAHLAGCSRCTTELSRLASLEPLLAELAEAGPVEQPSPRLLAGLVQEVTAVRRRGRVRRIALAACAAVLAVGGPAVTWALTSPETQPAVAVQQFSATDAVTGASATVGVSPRVWGSEVSLALSDVAGPQSCELLAVGSTGERQTVTTWTVPPSGYATDTLRTTGGTGLAPAAIDHFEVRTLDGRTLLVTVPARR